MPSRHPRLLVLALAFGTAITLGFDGFVASRIHRQHAALSYPTVRGQVIDSRVEERSDGDGTSYRASIRFAYEAAGQRRESDQWRYANEWTNIRADAQRTVAAFPDGSAATVYVNPADPDDAVLAPGVHGADAFFILFLGPFNAVVLCGWVWVVGRAAGIVPYRPADFEHVQLIQEAGLIRLRIHAAPPLISAIMAFGAVCFVSIFVVALGWGFNGPILAPLAALTVALFCGLLAFVRLRASLRAGRCDLVIDPVRRRLVLPPLITKGQPQDLPFSSISGIEVREGRRHQRGHLLSWEVRASLAPAQSLQPIAMLCDRAAADRLAAWFRDTLDLRTLAHAA